MQDLRSTPKQNLSGTGRNYANFRVI